MAGIEGMPAYLVATDDPREFDEEQLVSGRSLSDLLAGLAPGERLYLVDYASTPGCTRLTRLV